MSVMHVLYELLPPDVRIFFFNDTATPDIYPLSLPDALPISIKPAYRVTLADGTELVASADHRFLTNRGWKHVTGSYAGPLRRPHLTPNNELLGTGRFTQSPEKTVEYRLGYPCGMIPGEGHTRSEWFRR